MNIFSYKKGFTLVEMLVSLAIFAITALIAVGALLKIVDASRKAQSIKTAVNNLNFSLESISREARVGTHYVVAQSGTMFYFTSSEISPDNPQCHLRYAYKIDITNKSIQKAQESSCNQFGADPTSGFSLQLNPVTAPGLSITRGNFYITTSPDTNYSTVLMDVQGEAGPNAKSLTTFSVQTSVTQRLSN